MLDAKSDEALLAKVADYIENTHYIIYVDKIGQGRELNLTIKKIMGKVKKMKDPIARRELEKFVKQWARDILKGTTLDIFFNSKK